MTFTEPMMWSLTMAICISLGVIAGGIAGRR